MTVHYHGTLYDGTVFDSSRDRGDPFVFTIGQGQGETRTYTEQPALISKDYPAERDLMSRQSQYIAAEPPSNTLSWCAVIKGWDMGVITMKKGEKALLTCKAEYAYGEAGSPPKIPPNATLQFEVCPAHHIIAPTCGPACGS